METPDGRRISNGTESEFVSYFLYSCQVQEYFRCGEAAFHQPARYQQSHITTLFLRSSRGVRLTETGELLFRQVESAFQAISQGEEQLRKVQELGMGHLSIGVSTTLCKYVLLPHLSLFTRENPHIQISISCQSTYQTMEALEKGTVDIGLIGENDRMDKFHFHPVQEIRDVFVCTQRYLDNLCKRVSFSGSPSSRDIISHSTLMLLDKENITRQYMEKYLVKEEITAAQTIEITSMDLLIDFAKIDLGIACVIEDFVQEELDTGKLISLPLPVSVPSRKVGFAYLKNQTCSATAEKFSDFCMKHV